MTNKQKERLLTLLKNAIRDACINDDELKRLLKKGSGLQPGLVGLMDTLKRPELNKFKNEKVSSFSRYPDDWNVPSIAEQKKVLRKLFKGIDLTHTKELASAITAPANADGIALIPKLSYLSKFFGIENPYSSGYSKLVARIAEFFSTHREIYNRLHNPIEGHVRINERVRYLLEDLESESQGDLLVLPLSFGNIYAGYSLRNVRCEAFLSEQLPLTFVQVACLLLTMPGRLIANDNLSIDCPGDEYRSYKNDNNWSSSLCFRFSDKLEFATCGSENPHHFYGSAVGFLQG